MTVASDISSLKRMLITVTVMIAAVIEVLDSTIVNVALPAMMGELGASTDQITWVVTSYIVAAAIIMPMTGFFITRFGQKRLLLLSIFGFLLMSLLCGTAVSMTQMVIFRTLQGVFGAALLPMSQYILQNVYPKEERGKVMAIWGMGIMAGPILGPTLGGLITESMNWRWIFFVNIPVCLIAWLLATQVIDESSRVREKIDWFGFLLIGLGIGALQMMLDRGNTLDWFSSPTITSLAIVAVVALLTYGWRSWHQTHPIIDLKTFKDRNFWIGNFVVALFSASIFSVIVLQPIMLHDLMNYPVLTTGWIMAPRGIAAALAMMMVAGLIQRHHPRYFIFVGMIAAFSGTWWMSYFTLATPQWMIITSGFLQGIGIGFFFVPLSTLTFVNLPDSQNAQATGLFNFTRSLGFSIGVSLMSTFITRQTQVNWHAMVGHLNMFNDSVVLWLEKVGLSLGDPKAVRLLGGVLYQQASTMAFLQSYRLVSVCFLGVLPFVFMMRYSALRENADTGQ